MRRTVVAGRTRNSPARYEGLRHRPPTRLALAAGAGSASVPSFGPARRPIPIFLLGGNGIAQLAVDEPGLARCPCAGGAAPGSTSQRLGRLSAICRCRSMRALSHRIRRESRRWTADLVQPDTARWRDSRPAPCTCVLSGVLAFDGTPPHARPVTEKAARASGRTRFLPDPVNRQDRYIHPSSRFSGCAERLTTGWGLSHDGQVTAVPRHRGGRRGPAAHGDGRKGVHSPTERVGWPHLEAQDIRLSAPLAVLVSGWIGPLGVLSCHGTNGVRWVCKASQVVPGWVGGTSQTPSIDIRKSGDLGNHYGHFEGRLWEDPGPPRDHQSRPAQRSGTDRAGNSFTTSLTGS